MTVAGVVLAQAIMVSAIGISLAMRYLFVFTQDAGMAGMESINPPAPRPLCCHWKAVGYGGRKIDARANRARLRSAIPKRALATVVAIAKFYTLRSLLV